MLMPPKRCNHLSGSSCLMSDCELPLLPTKSIVCHRHLNASGLPTGTLLRGELLAHHVGIAAMAKEPLAQPVLMAVERLGARRRLERHHTTGIEIRLHRVMTAAEVPRDPLATPPAHTFNRNISTTSSAVFIASPADPSPDPRLRRFVPPLFDRPSLFPSFIEGAIPRVAEGGNFPCRLTMCFGPGILPSRTISSNNVVPTPI